MLVRLVQVAEQDQGVEVPVSELGVFIGSLVALVPLDDRSLLTFDLRKPLRRLRLPARSGVALTERTFLQRSESNFVATTGRFSWTANVSVM
jgi:hypothetical protein